MNTIKLWAFSIFGAVMTVLLGWFKYRGDKIEKLKERLRDADTENKANEAKEEAHKEYAKEKLIVGEKYENKKNEANSRVDDTPLSDASIELLNNKGKGS